MEISIRGISIEATRWDVKRAIGSVLHGNDFYNPTDEKTRPINFQVDVNEGPHGIHHNGTGQLYLANSSVGYKFLRIVREQRIRVQGHPLKFSNSKKQIDHRLSQILDKAPYIPPETEERREDKLNQLSLSLHINKVQFGIFYRLSDDAPNASRHYSNEYEVSFSDKSAGILGIEYDHKLIRVQLGDPMLEEEAHNIAINFANIKKFAIGHDSFGIPFICFDLFVPPIFQRERFNRTLTGDAVQDSKKFRQRIDSINDAHGVVAPYAYQVRLVMHHDNQLNDFAMLCYHADLQKPFRTRIEASAMGFFARKQLYRIDVWLKQCEWSIAFQLEGLLRNGLLNTHELMNDLQSDIQQLINEQSAVAADILKRFAEAVHKRDPKQRLDNLFKQTVQEALTGSKPLRPRLFPGHFLCHHVTVTPTRILFEGPYPIQSNRVIRKYMNYQDNFIRVDFRDEDRLQYRWERDVDGKILLTERVGGTLKNGLSIGGRLFEFLAYSSSALREHAVWFMYPFRDDDGIWTTASVIRQGLGDFSNVIKYPSKYAARMAQAFTATDPSVTIPRACVEEMADLGKDPYLHTDGVGTISKELGNQIWDALCKDRDENYRKTAIQPSAYQIRFLGYKGVVGVDERLEGIKIRLRKSMNKFQIPGDGDAEIEIARAFERPGITYLNRPLITILEDRGVNKSAFMELQRLAVAEIHAASDTLIAARDLFRTHSLGTSYHLSFIIQCLMELGVGMKDQRPNYVLQDAFIERLIAYSKVHVLRDIKHAARIPVPDSYMLVGIADEGPAYEMEGVKDVFKLQEGQIYACVQRPEDPEPVYLQGHVVISRSPTVHPGDVQRVWAIGRPPPKGTCFFRNLKNVVVLPSVGERSLASMLGGGDLDGDLYSLIKEPSLLPTEHVEPASYESAGTQELPDKADSTIDDVCNFVVEYIQSDVLGLLSDRHIIIADQSKYGTQDQKCIKLAQLCSQAVDYPKNGVPVNMADSPSRLIPYKPDWKGAEENMAPTAKEGATPTTMGNLYRNIDYYESPRALGELYRSITFNKPDSLTPQAGGNNVVPSKPFIDSISQALIPFVNKHLGTHINTDAEVREMSNLFHSYASDLRSMQLLHALSDSPDSRLEEEEIVVGTILAPCSQHRYRKDRTYRMRLHSATVVRDVQRRLYEPSESYEIGALRYGLRQAWLAWDFGKRYKFLPGANSFAIIALGVIFNVLEGLGEITLKKGSVNMKKTDSPDLGREDEDEDENTERI